MAVQVTNNSSTVVIKAAGIQGPTGPAGAVQPTGSFATTGSNSFIGDQIISGSLTVSGSSTFTNIGSAIFSGSIIATQGITGSFSGTATSASFAVTASHALFAVSASHEITFEVSSSHAQTADQAGNLFGTPSIVVNEITASIISASGDIITNALTSSGLNYPTTDGNRAETIITDGAGNLSFGLPEKLHLQVRNDDSVDITAGTPIYSTGEIGGSERINVRIASASDASKMPAIGIVETTLTPTGDTKDGFAILNGIYNTNVTPVSGTPALGDNIYVHADGGVTTIKPSGSNLIQNIGTVLKTNGTVIQGMKVSSIDRTNDVPNLLDNTIFFGSGSDQTQQIHISGALDQTVINNITASGNISASGEVEANKFISNGVDIAQFAAGAVQLGGGAVQPAALSGTGITLGISGLNQPVTVVSALTASIISASGAITGDTVTTSGNIQAGARLLATGRIIGDVSVAAPTGTFTTITNVNTTHVTASGNISASGDLRADTLRVGVTPDNTNGLLISASTFNGDTRDVQIIYPNHGLHFNSDISNNHVLALAGNNVGIRKEPDDGNALQISGSISMVDGDIFGATNITASGNISASGDVIGLSGSFANLSVSSLAAIGDATSDTINIKGNTTFTILEGDSGIFRIREEAIDFPILDIKVDNSPGAIFAFDPHLYDNDATGQGKMGIGVPTASIDAKLHLRQLAGSGEPNNLLRIDTGTTPSFRIAKEGNVFISGSMAVQGGKPITTHTTHFSASLANAGHYLIVGGNLTCSISASTAPVGAEYEFFQTSSAGNMLFETGSGVTLISKNNSLRLAQQGSSAVLKKVGTGTFHLMGDLT